ncbi:hypothetical protein KOW79_020589 [Hemibagrus wyckioides]|uniref:Uncharacterized protein n=1 Tax=Hemibagrus wyckioides TaxID=337641 RepID=A0A9D3SDC9_9TELE|nr:hypothetical protein KOW79_020589 [Hemibagrus wyckioides]
MVLEMEKERKNMEKEKNQERFELLERKREDGAEGGKKELETADKKLKRFSIPSFKKLSKKNNTKESQQMKKEQKRARATLGLCS